MALPVQSGFLDKVYDVYETRDWHYGKPELNPVRELKTSEILSQREIETRMMNRIQERMQEIVDDTIKKQLAKRKKGILGFNDFSLSDTIINNLGAAGTGSGTGADSGEDSSFDAREGGTDYGIGDEFGEGGRRNPNAVGPGETLSDPSDNSRFKQKVVELGGDPSGGQLFDFAPTPHNPPDPPHPLEPWILPIFVSMPMSSEDIQKYASQDFGGGLDDGPFKMDCDNVIQDGSDLDSSEDGSPFADGAGGDGSGTGGRGTGTGTGTSVGGTDDGSGDGEGGDGEGTGEISETDEDVNNAIDTLLDEVHEALLQQDLALFECAAVELGFLRLVLAMLKVFKILARIIDYVLSLILPIISIVQLACGAWLNPSNIGKIIQLIVMKVMSILVMLLTTILQLIWDLLNIDCVASTTQKVIDEIKATLAGLDQVMGEFNGNFVASTLKKVNRKVLSPLSAIADQVRSNIETWQQADDSFNEMMKGLSAESLKATLSNAVSGALSPFVSRITGIVNNAKSVVPAAEKLQESIKGEQAKQNAATQVEKSKALVRNILKGPAAGLSSPRVRGLRTT